jgi:membrane-bound inhibitor of C-type lysozyme
VTVPAAYVNAAEGSAAVVTVEGRQVALIAEPAASGVRYAWPSGGSGYVWWTKDNEATLLWRDGTTGTETVILPDCRAG